MAKFSQTLLLFLGLQQFQLQLQLPHPPKYKSPPPRLGSLANFVQQLSYYLHAKFGAFTPECTIFSPYGWTCLLIHQKTKTSQGCARYGWGKHSDLKC